MEAVHVPKKPFSTEVVDDFIATDSSSSSNYVEYGD